LKRFEKLAQEYAKANWPVNFRNVAEEAFKAAWLECRRECGEYVEVRAWRGVAEFLKHKIGDEEIDETNGRV
jgi:hypothetical protein